MSEISIQIDNNRIESFLQGSDPQKYIVAVEAEYNTPTVKLIINDPETGKRIEDGKYKPFVWFKEELGHLMYNGEKLKRLAASEKYNVRITTLKTSNSNGVSPNRLLNGYKYMATCSSSYNDLTNFFKDGGVDVYDKEVSKLLIRFSPVEQYLIQTGKRLFKGMDDYDDVHRLQFDLETEGLYPSKHAIFQVGVRDNRGMEEILETTGNTLAEKRESERRNIEYFFKIIDLVRPDVITGYNSENFDWSFIFDRAERLSIPITELAITLNRLSKIKRKPATLKLGGEMEAYNQTNMWGYNIIDISHAVRRAMAINSEIKSWGLKYITQYSKIAKPNRVYVPGDKINLIWKDTENEYAFNDVNGEWYKITEKKPLITDFKKVKGNYIVQRYLCDDLWETEQIDNLYNQASFLIGKMLPTTFQKSSTMGTVGQWKLIMAAWSYENNLAIPETQPKRNFTGGLSRLLELGYALNVAKLDYAALYPKTQLTHGIFPELDISGVMMGLLAYIVDTRDENKFLAEKEMGIIKELNKEVKLTLNQEEINKINKCITEHTQLFTLYDKKQLPLKILANSWFGGYGAPYIFNWGDTDSAEETTCRGRQYLRLMVRFFTEKYNFKALVLDTDGVNFSFPSTINEVKYIANGSHWKTIDNKDKELTGLDAVLAEFNETYMKGRMGLDIDYICSSTINFSRKNYANLINGKVKLVGNSIKSKKMSVYIEDFLNKAIRMLLDGDGQSFINYYYEYVDKIYNFGIPLVKIATKAKVKNTIDNYKKKSLLKNKKGKPLPKQAHMELAIREGLDIGLGDVIYYINTGSDKSQGDVKTTIKNKMTKKQILLYNETNGHPPVFINETQINCNLIKPEIVDRDFELIKEVEMLKKALLIMKPEDTENIEATELRIKTIDAELFTDEYNVDKYLTSFNNKVKPLLVCFNPEIRKKILLSVVKTKDKKTKITTKKLKERLIFTKQECELVSGMPDTPEDQDSYEELMVMEDKEIRFWTSVNKIPNDMEDESKWGDIVADYYERIRIAKEDGIKLEKEKFDGIAKHLEIDEINEINKGLLPKSITNIVNLVNDGVFTSIKWNEPISSFDNLLRYENEAIERDMYYKETKFEKGDDKYNKWVEYVAERNYLTGQTITESNISKEETNNKIIPEIKNQSIINLITEDVIENELTDDFNDVE